MVIRYKYLKIINDLLLNDSYYYYWFSNLLLKGFNLNNKNYIFINLIKKKKY